MTNLENLIERLSTDLTSIKPASSPFIVGCYWAAALAVYLGILVTVFGIRSDILTKLPFSLFFAEIVLLFLLIVTSAISALLLSYPDLYQKPVLAFSPLPILVAFILVLAFEALRDTPPSPSPLHGVECLKCISIFSIVPAGFLFHRMRKFASVHYSVAGAISALAAFSVGAFIMRLAEKTDSIPHLVAWHYLPMLGTIFIGLLLGRLILKW